MVAYELRTRFPGVIDGIIQNTPCTHCRGTLGFIKFTNGNTGTFTQLIAKCFRCQKEQSIEAEASLVRR